MLRVLFRLIVIVVIVVAAIAFFSGYRFGGGRASGPASGAPAVGTSGRSGAIDTTRARERGAQAGEKVAEAGNRAAELISDGALTTKIKSKMALDDTVKARDIDVTTRDGNVTLVGYVHSEKARERAVALARETAGVRSVTDRLQVR